MPIIIGSISFTFILFMIYTPSIAPSITPSFTPIFAPIFTPIFIVENIETKSLNGGITKKFTSLATNATMFRWKFGDGKELETQQNPIYYAYKEKGIYNVQHQTCIGPACCSGWCTQTITVGAPKPSLLPVIATAGFFFLILPRKECEDFKTKKDCKRDDCKWLEKEKKCVKRCAEEYKTEKVKISGKEPHKEKTPYKFECKPIKKK